MADASDLHEVSRLALIVINSQLKQDPNKRDALLQRANRGRSGVLSKGLACRFLVIISSSILVKVIGKFGSPTQLPLRFSGQRKEAEQAASRCLELLHAEGNDDSRLLRSEVLIRRAQAMAGSENFHGALKEADEIIKSDPVIWRLYPFRALENVSVHPGKKRR